MKVFVAGSTGAIGRQLLPLLVRNGHEVTALVRTSQQVTLVEGMGAKSATAEAFNTNALNAAIRIARPDVVIHELTALSGMKNLKHFDQQFERTNRFRTETTDVMLAAARMAGARRFIAQSYCGWPFAREGSGLKTEDDPLDPAPPPDMSKTLAAIQYLEKAVLSATGIDTFALRYGSLYGPATDIATGGSIVRLVRKRMMPIVGGGAGVWSFLHVEDAARAAVAAVEGGAPGIYNIVDDEPAPVAVWLPELAKAVGAKPPFRVPLWIGNLALGDAGVLMMTQMRGASNAKAKRELGWTPTFESWRRGFVEGLG